jgi:succinate dehydrogenase / fumarate reductase cytochrome b subunit
MSQSHATRAKPRPLSPHLSIYRPPITMTTSILHRITGGALYVGTLLVAWWLIAAATSQSHFDFVSGLLGSWIGRLVLLGYTWALMLHLLGGIRHFIWDTGVGMEKHTASKFAWATLVGSVVLTLAVWVAGYYVRGA